jgi:hypothetical protein
MTDKTLNQITKGFGMFLCHEGTEAFFSFVFYRLGQINKSSDEFETFTSINSNHRSQEKTTFVDNIYEDLLN